MKLGIIALFGGIIGGFLIPYLLNITDPVFCKRIADILSPLIPITAILTIFVLYSQRELSKKIDKSTKTKDFLEAYNNLSNDRRNFWLSVSKLEKEYFAEHPYQSTLIAINNNERDVSHRGILNIRCDFPSPSPSKENNLLEYIGKNEVNWEKYVIWEFAKYSIKHCLNNTHFGNAPSIYDNFCNNYTKLADFWVQWYFMMDSQEYVNPDVRELILLTWLELAFIKITDTDRPVGFNRQYLFQLTEEEYQKCENKDIYI